MNRREYQSSLYSATGGDVPPEARNPAWEWLQNRQDAAQPTPPVHSGQLADYVQKQRFQARPANRSPAAPNLTPNPPTTQPGQPAAPAPVAAAAPATAAPIRDANGMILGYAPGTGPTYAPRPAVPVAPATPVAPAAPVVAPVAAPVAIPAAAPVPVAPPPPAPVAAPVAPAAAPATPVSQISNWGQGSDVTRQDYNPAFGVDFSTPWNVPGNRPAGWSDQMESQTNPNGLPGYRGANMPAGGKFGTGPGYDDSIQMAPVKMGTYSAVAPGDLAGAEMDARGRADPNNRAWGNGVSWNEHQAEIARLNTEAHAYNASLGERGQPVATTAPGPASAAPPVVAPPPPAPRPPESSMAAPSTLAGRPIVDTQPIQPRDPVPMTGSPVQSPSTEPAKPPGVDVQTRRSQYLNTMHKAAGL